MARIKITKKDEPEPEEQAQPETDEFTPDPEVHPQDGGPVTESVEELAKGMAEDVALDHNNPGPRGAETMRPMQDPDEDPNIDPDTNYPKIALLRVSVGADDERSMDEWIEDIRKDLANHKNATVLTKHFLVDGEPVAAHKVATDE